jgi:hypothetical protein
MLATEELEGTILDTQRYHGRDLTLEQAMLGSHHRTTLEVDHAGSGWTADLEGAAELPHLEHREDQRELDAREAPGQARLSPAHGSSIANLRRTDATIV